MNPGIALLGHHAFGQFLGALEVFPLQQADLEGHGPLLELGLSVLHLILEELVYKNAQRLTDLRRSLPVSDLPLHSQGQKTCSSSVLSIVTEQAANGGERRRRTANNGGTFGTPSTAVGASPAHCSGTSTGVARVRPVLLFAIRTTLLHMQVQLILATPWRCRGGTYSAVAYCDVSQCAVTKVR